MRVGIGIDFHQFAPGRKLILGGVEVPYENASASASE
jgi:2-C-methyl-D-erythritol 2,4-cyclodiphosphate synthase